VIPDADKPVSFETHVKPLFRELDRRSMQSHFDLWSQMTSANTQTPSSPASNPAPCLATARGPKHRSTSSNGGQRAASQADAFH
jgi:hypothetical protein